MSAASLLAEAKRDLEGGDVSEAGRRASAALEALSKAGEADGLAEAVRILIAAGAPPGELEAVAVTLEELLERLRTEGGSKLAEARVLVARGELHCARLEAEKAEEAAKEARALGELGAGGGPIEQQVLNILVNAYLMKEAPAEAIKAASELLALAQRSGDREGEAGAWQAIAGAHGLRAEVEKASGAAEEALQAAQKALAIYRELGGRRRGEATALAAVARAQLRARRAQEGLKAAEESLALWRSIGQTKGAVTALEIIIQARAMQNNPMAGLRAANEELELVRRMGNKRGQVELLDMITHTHAVLREPVSAIHYARQALELYWALDDKAGQGWTLHTIAEMQRMQGELAAATASAREALAAFRAAGNRRGEEQALTVVGSLLAQRGTPELAPRRGEAVRSLRELVRAIQDRSTDNVRAAEGRLNSLRDLVTDQEIVGALQPLLERDEGAGPFLRELGWQIALPEAGPEQLQGTKITQYSHKAFYLHTILAGGMNFGPQFRAVHPYRKGTISVDGLENTRPMTVSQLPETEAWQMETLYRHGIMDSGIQQTSVLSFPPH